MTASHTNESRIRGEEGVGQIRGGNSVGPPWPITGLGNLSQIASGHGLGIDPKVGSGLGTLL